jgi:AraC-like DNA-binding protein
MSHLLGTPDTAVVPRVALHPRALFPIASRATPPALSERRRVALTAAYMAGHLTERLSISQLASRVHVSPSQLHVIFKRHTGYTPIDFHIHLRMAQGCILFEVLTLTVKEVADALGYEDAFYFSRLFKLVSRVSPREYRRLPATVREQIRADILPHICSELIHLPNVTGGDIAHGSLASSHEP